jgi:hypothetical protein
MTASPAKVRYEITFQNMASSTSNETKMSHAAEGVVGCRIGVAPQTNS